MKRLVKCSHNINFNETDDIDSTLDTINTFIQNLSRQYRKDTGSLAGLLWVCYKVKTYGPSRKYRIVDVPEKQLLFIVDALKKWSYLKDLSAKVTINSSYDDDIIEIAIPGK